ncbi:Transcriptional regulator, LysR family, partial [Pseudomonas syringae pv. maculicola]
MDLANLNAFIAIAETGSFSGAGRALLPRAYQILNVLDDTRRALTNLTGEVSGRLTLATSHHIGLQ